MTKTELRKKYKVLRNELTPIQIEDFSLQIANRLLELDIWHYSYYHLFLSIEEQCEVNTDFILNILSGKDKNIIISKSDFSTGRMTNYLLTDNTRIKKNKHNIPEPIEGIEVSNNKLDLVFIPLLACDKKGNRVGYGKGFYDTFLKTCRPETVKIGLSFFEPEDKITDINESDIPLDYCVTPKHIYSF